MCPCGFHEHEPNDVVMLCKRLLSESGVTFNKFISASVSDPHLPSASTITSSLRVYERVSFSLYRSLSLPTTPLYLHSTPLFLSTHPSLSPHSHLSLFSISRISLHLCHLLSIPLLYLSVTLIYLSVTLLYISIPLCLPLSSSPFLSSLSPCFSYSPSISFLSPSLPHLSPSSLPSPTPSSHDNAISRLRQPRGITLNKTIMCFYSDVSIHIRYRHSTWSCRDH